MRFPIDRVLSAASVVILDGALATEMERRGADLVDPLWSAKYLLEQPDLIREIHAEYFRAGADVATTATYQATFPGFARRGIDRPRAAALMRLAVTLAVTARDEFWARSEHRLGRVKPLVAASVGPYGAMLGDGSEYRGGYACTDAELIEFHRDRLEVLADSGADLFAFETLPSLREARLLAELLREFPDKSAWMSFSCRDSARTCEGQAIAECAAALDSYAQIAAVGVNCSRPQDVCSLLRALRGATTKPLLAYPNSGEVYDPIRKTWHGHGAETAYAAFASQWYREGARLIGGCCRTTPEDIRAVRQALEVTDRKN